MVSASEPKPFHFQSMWLTHCDFVILIPKVMEAVSMDTNELIHYLNYLSLRLKIKKYHLINKEEIKCHNNT